MPETPCCRIGCTLPAKYGVTLLFWRRNRRGTPARTVTPLTVCEIHRRLLSVERVLTAQAEALAGGLLSAFGFEPDPRLTELDFMPLTLLATEAELIPGASGRGIAVVETEMPVDVSFWARDYNRADG